MTSIPHVQHDPSPQADGFVGPEPGDLRTAARVCQQLGTQLCIELALDAEAIRLGEALTVDEIADLARRAAHAAGLVLTGAIRVCVRCEAPLTEILERLSGVCTPCLRNRRAAIQRAVRS